MYKSSVVHIEKTGNWEPSPIARFALHKRAYVQSAHTMSERVTAHKR